MTKRRGARRPERSGESGQIIVLFAIAIVVLMLFASLVIDVGVLRNNRQLLLNSVDAGALAGGTMMPVDGCNNAQSATTACSSINATALANVVSLVASTMQGGYPNLSASDYTISYRCLIGVNSSSPPQPYVSRDVPLVCNPRGALGHTPVASDFRGAGSVRYSPCSPNLGDRCNVIVISASTMTPYSFGRVAGINQGWTGTVQAAACNGPCGEPPNAPVDLVVIIDRTASMSSADVQATRDAAKAILGVYSPDLQRVALGFLGPSSTMRTCSGTGGGPSVNVSTLQPATPVAPTTGTGTAWVQTTTGTTGGATSLTISKPTGTNSTNLLVATIAVAGGSAENVTAPGGWTLIRRTDNSTVLSVLSYYKVAGGSEAGSYAWTISPSAKATGAIVRYSGVNTSSPIDLSSGNNSGGSSNSSVVANSVTTTGSAEVILGVFGTAARTTFTPASGMTERVDVANGTSTNAGPTIEVASITQASAGSVGDKTAAAAASGRWAAQQIAIKPTAVDTYGASVPADIAKWIPIGFTGTDTDTPSPAWNEVYSNGSGTVYGTTHIGSAINCFDNPGGTGTNLATPVAMAAAFLQAHGRPNVKWGILLETDGQPNYGSTGDPGNYTCQAAVNNATAAKAITNADGARIELFTVGFGLDGSNDVDCPDSSGTYMNKNVTKALADMASTALSPNPNGTASGCVTTENTDGDHFFCQPRTEELTTIFETVATELSGQRTHLVMFDPPPSVYSISPTSGSRLGGTTVTVTGKYFTGTTSVTVGGVNAGFVFVSDTELRVTTPAGTVGSSVHIVVTNGGGSSPPVNGDKFTYT